MKYPELMELNTSREMIDVFGGYNHNLRIGDGEFYDMTNLTSSNYPVLAPRPQRGRYTSLSKPTLPGSEYTYGMIAKDALYHVEEEYFVGNSYRVNMSLLPGEKTLLSMGTYVIIMPDKKYINTVANDEDGTFEWGYIEAGRTLSGLTLSLCTLAGAEYVQDYVQATEPSHPSDGNLWVDTSSTPYTLKQYSEAAKVWVPISATYIKISCANIASPFGRFNEGDGITISGVEDDDLLDLNTSAVIQAKGNDYIVVAGFLNESRTLDYPITIERRMPEMDFIIESGNRLWGCRYGTALNGEVVNEIYASKLGDFKNWNVFQGISTDSYVASVGTDGEFTGAISHMGYPIFFKENCMHKVYGNYPSNYQIQTTPCRGVQEGCRKSLAIVNETLYYKARSAICAYDGSLPVEVSTALGEVSYSDAVAGVLGNKYYVSMKDTTDTYHLFVYDTYKQMWHREDNTRAVQFCNSRGELYYIDYADWWIKTINGSGTKDTSKVKWEAITGIIGTNMPDKKYISRIVVRLSLTMGSRVTIRAQYDSDGAWEQLYTASGTKLCSFSIPIRPRRCDHLRLRIDGEGDVKIYSICKTIEQGSDV